MNHLILTVKIIKVSTVQVFLDGLNMTKLVVQVTNPRSPKILNYIYLTAWGTLAKELQNYYTIGDYIIVEGYLNIIKKHNVRNYKKSEVKVSKVYPLYLRKNKFDINSKNIPVFYDRIPF
nr:single-stranded DNA-binding protein [Cavernulicola chilensis]